jgi:hypothetical protein
VASRKAQASATNARQAKLAAIRAQEARKRRQMTIVMGAIGVVLVIIVAFVIAYVATGSNNNAPAASAKDSKVVNAATSVSPSVFDKVGVGSVDVAHGAGPQPIPGNHSLTADGKPKVLYVGAEYCPYCAAERWAVVAALSRFGTFSDLGTTSSTSRDVYPSTATLSFHGASYDSKYLSFAGYETADRDGNPLDHPASEDEKAFRTFDAPPYVSADAKYTIPFVDFGGKYLINGATYSPSVLQGKSHLEIAQAMHDPSSDVAQGVVGTANMITAAICKTTDQQPANVCNSPGVTTAVKALKGS